MILLIFSEVCHKYVLGLIKQLYMVNLFEIKFVQLLSISAKFYPSKVVIKIFLCNAFTDDHK